MIISDLLCIAGELLKEAQTKYDGGSDTEAVKTLAILRDFLNDQLESEAGGSSRRCRVCGCTDLNPCPDGCCWLENDLCSRC